MANPEKERASYLGQREVVERGYSTRVKSAMAIAALAAGVLLERELIVGGMRGAKKAVRKVTDAINTNR